MNTVMIGGGGGGGGGGGSGAISQHDEDHSGEFGIANTSNRPFSAGGNMSGDDGLLSSRPSSANLYIPSNRSTFYGNTPPLSMYPPPPQQQQQPLQPAISTEQFQSLFTATNAIKDMMETMQSRIHMMENQYSNQQKSFHQYYLDEKQERELLKNNVLTLSNILQVQQQQQQQQHVPPPLHNGVSGNSGKIKRGSAGSFGGNGGGGQLSSSSMNTFGMNENSLDFSAISSSHVDSHLSSPRPEQGSSIIGIGIGEAGFGDEEEGDDEEHEVEQEEGGDIILYSQYDPQQPPQYRQQSSIASHSMTNLSLPPTTLSATLPPMNDPSTSRLSITSTSNGSVNGGGMNMLDRERPKTAGGYITSTSNTKVTSDSIHSTTISRSSPTAAVRPRSHHQSRGRSASPKKKSRKSPERLIASAGAALSNNHHPHAQQELTQTNISFSSTFPRNTSPSRGQAWMEQLPLPTITSPGKKPPVTGPPKELLSHIFPVDMQAPKPSSSPKKLKTNASAIQITSSMMSNSEDQQYPVQAKESVPSDALPLPKNQIVTSNIILDNHNSNQETSPTSSSGGAAITLLPKSRSQQPVTRMSASMEDINNSVVSSSSNHSSTD